MTELHDLTTQTVAVGDVKLYPGNARKGNLRAIADSIEENGFYTPLVVQKSTNYILAGNHRYRAATELLDFTELPAVFLDVDDVRAKKIVLADNKTSDDAEYDNAALAELLESLDGDLEGTGWSEEELAELLDEGEEDDDPADSEHEEEYGEVFEIIVTLNDPSEQEALFERLSEEGYKVKVQTL
ncbi:DNA binding protein [Arthrobacter phage EastWest]|uniref:DNA binding protein n=1 Tax=Arthrobacter phage EastWest TaxID=2894292 RepID=A0AAE8YKJ3_9CAUD|nr:DNA binding protein [Arthrobacter phage EastWest]